VPDDNPDAPPTRYSLEGSQSVLAGATWTTVGDPVLGDDHLHRMEVPVIGGLRFFRLRAE